MDTELSDDQWKLIVSVIPKQGRMGRPRADDRRTLNGILWVLRTGSRWEDMPKQFGVATTCWRRLRRWEEQGVWTRLWQTMLQTLDSRGQLEWSRAFLDGSFAPAKRGVKR